MLRWGLPVSRDISVKAEYLTRVEGHCNIVVKVVDGVLQKTELQVVEAPRFFEAMLRGRSVFEAQHITSRICGICACGHSLASIQAAEAALGFQPSEQTLNLRELLLYLEHLDSHLLHIHMLVLPDLLGLKSFLGLKEAHFEVLNRALRLKKTCNELCDLLVGRHVHPISAVVGGFTKLPDFRDLEEFELKLRSILQDLKPTVELISAQTFPEFYRETEYVALAKDGNGYPLLDGEVGCSDGVRRPKEEYLSITNEFLVPHSSAKHAKGNRGSYAVGALARFNLNADRLHPQAKVAAEKLGLASPTFKPFLNSCAQLVECVHCASEALALVERLATRGIDQAEKVLVGLNENQAIPVQAGSGVGAVEVPRGLLFHHYQIDDQGIIQKANCVIPTAQNLNNLEDDIRKFVPEILDRSDQEIGFALEMLVRAYDPCISCSTHLLKIGP